MIDWTPDAIDAADKILRESVGWRDDIVRAALEAAVKAQKDDIKEIINDAGAEALELGRLAGWNSAIEAAAKVAGEPVSFDISLWHSSTKREMTTHTAKAIVAALRALAKTEAS